MPIYLALALILGIGVGSQLNYQTTGFVLPVISPKKEKISRLINYIEYNYVDEIDTDSLLDGVINLMLS